MLLAGCFCSGVFSRVVVVAVLVGCGLFFRWNVFLSSAVSSVALLGPKPPQLTVVWEEETLSFKANEGRKKMPTDLMQSLSLNL